MFYILKALLLKALKTKFNQEARWYFSNIDARWIHVKCVGLELMHPASLAHFQIYSTIAIFNHASQAPISSPLSSNKHKIECGRQRKLPFCKEAKTAKL